MLIFNDLDSSPCLGVNVARLNSIAGLKFVESRLNVFVQHLSHDNQANAFSDNLFLITGISPQLSVFGQQRCNRWEFLRSFTSPRTTTFKPQLSKGRCLDTYHPL